MRQALIGILVLIALPARAAEPYRFGPLGGRLTPADLTALEQSIDPPAQLWAVLGWYSQTLPEEWHVDVFLPPTHFTERLARGSILHLSCSPKEGGCAQWIREPEPGSYAQVPAPERPHSPGNSAWSDLRRPIRISGDFSDEDLVSLVTYIRAGPGPQLPPGQYGMTVSKGVPIQDIERQPNGSVWVRLTRDGGLGETATVVRTSRGWQVTDVVHWVA
jgi:hypothetical protein